MPRATNYLKKKTLCYSKRWQWPTQLSFFLTVACMFVLVFSCFASSNGKKSATEIAPLVHEENRKSSATGV